MTEPDDFPAAELLDMAANHEAIAEHREAAMRRYGTHHSSAPIHRAQAALFRRAVACYEALRERRYVSRENSGDAVDRPSHVTRPVRVWADVDVGIVGMVEYLNTIPGVRTTASCQGTFGEGGPAPYRAQVMAHWPEDQEARLRAEFDVTDLGECWGYLHPRGICYAAPLSESLEPSDLADMLDVLVAKYSGDAEYYRRLRTLAATIRAEVSR